MSAPWVAVVLALALVVIVETIALAGLYGRVSLSLSRVESFLLGIDLNQMFKGLPIGAVAPELKLLVTPERTSSTNTGLAGGSVLIVLLEESCGPCKDLLDDIDRNGDLISNIPKIAVVPDDGTQIRFPAGWHVVQQHDREISRALKVNAIPYAYVLDAQRKVVAAGIPNAVKDLAVMWTQLPQAAQTPAEAVVGAATG